MEMRERIARVIDPDAGWDERVKTEIVGYKSKGGQRLPIHKLIDERGSLTGPIAQAFAKADAVLRAMREPTNEMAIASADVRHTVLGSWDFAEVYRKMIDAALAPTRPDSAQEEV